MNKTKNKIVFKVKALLDEDEVMLLGYVFNTEATTMFYNMLVAKRDSESLNPNEKRMFNVINKAMYG